MSQHDTELPGATQPAPEWLTDLQGKQVKIAATLMSVGLVAGAAMGVVHYMQGRHITGLLLLTLGATAGTLMLLALKSKLTVRIIHISLAVIMLLLFFTAVISGKETPASAMLFGLPAFVLGLLGERKAMAFWSVTGLCALVLVYFWPALGIPIPMEIPTNFPVIYFSVAAILLIFISLIGYLLAGSQRLMLAELAAANNQITVAMDVAVRANESKQDFLARMSHELRTPLNAILGFCQVLTNDSKSSLSAQQRTNIHHIEASGAKLLELVDEILEITKDTESDFSQTNAVELWPLLNLFAGAHQTSADHKSIKISLSRMDHIHVQCDSKQLGRVMDQLLSNAIAFNRHNGSVTIDATAIGRNVVIAVADTGYGMTPDQIEAAFSPFGERDKRFSADQGTGVGLALVKKIIDQMHARISVTSELGKGSRFLVTLPLARVPTSSPHAAPVIGSVQTNAQAPALKSPDGALSVLYVEDAELNVLLMQALFEELPQFKLHVATTGAEAVQLIETIDPWLMLLDLNLPDTHGIELLAKLRRDKRLQSVDAIAVSADATKETIDRALANGFAAYWVKPVNLDTIRNALLRRVVQWESHRASARP